MFYSRRWVLKTGSIAGLAALVPGGKVFGQQKGGPPTSGGKDGALAPVTDTLSKLSRSSFEGHVGETFKFSRVTISPLDMQLTAVEDCRSKTSSARERTAESEGAGECFALVFQGSFGPILKQNTYTIDHPALGNFQLLIAHDGTQGRYGFNYVAIINRMTR
jgi:uncharacterized protein DUF6916